MHEVHVTLRSRVSLGPNVYRVSCFFAFYFPEGQLSGELRAEKTHPGRSEPFRKVPNMNQGSVDARRALPVLPGEPLEQGGGGGASDGRTVTGRYDAPAPAQQHGWSACRAFFFYTATY